jgi:hypothetical protein
MTIILSKRVNDDWLVAGKAWQLKVEIKEAAASIHNFLFIS